MRDERDTNRIYSIEHEGGVKWSEAPMPPEKHDCAAQTSAFTGSGMVYRCACGAISYDRDWRLGNTGWARRNERRFPAGTPRPQQRKRRLRFLFA